MKIVTILTLISIGTAVEPIDAVTLKDCPVQDAMTASVAMSRIGGESGVRFQSDDFGDPEPGSEGREIKGKKSTFQAVLYSALIPGGGQYYLGRKKAARYFFAAEAVTWVGYIAFRTYGNWKKDDYINYAAVNAQAQLEGKSDEFMDWVGFYENIREFNTLGRAFDPDRDYLPDTPENHWEWETPEERQGFRDLRNSSREAYKRSDFMIGVAVIDRVISIIDAVRSVGKVNRTIGEEQFSRRDDSKLKLSVNPLSLRRQFSLTFYTNLW